ncbi:hypothetical protein [Streptomyces globosus]|uniref:hypothetical protein n=1 Tax=Streptomyces globosus TaxID=68209 RepID=UPI0013B43FBF|nr:hypothetical protein [Streptomyces globosus]
MTHEIPAALAADVKMCTDFRDLHAPTGMFAEVQALRARLQFTLGRCNDQIPLAGRTPDAIWQDQRRIGFVARQGFEALRAAEDLLPPEESLLAARGALNEAADDLEMGIFHELEEAGRDSLLEAVERLIAASAKASRWRVAQEAGVSDDS